MYAFRLVSMGLIVTLPITGFVVADPLGGAVGPVSADCSVNPNGDVIQGGIRNVVQWCEEGLAFWVWFLDEDGTIPVGHGITNACGLAPINCVKHQASAGGSGCQISGSPPTRVASNCRVTFKATGSATLWVLPGSLTVTQSSGSSTCSWITAQGCVKMREYGVTLPPIGETEAKCARDDSYSVGGDGVNRVQTATVTVTACFAFVSFSQTITP